MNKTEILVHKWYGNSEGALFNVTELTSDNLPKGYGFSHAGVFVGKDYNPTETWSIEGIYELREEEISKALIKEAKKRGYKKGITYHPYNSLMHYTSASSNIIYGFYEVKNVLHMKGSYGLIFDNGNWAEIIESKNK